MILPQAKAKLIMAMLLEMRSIDEYKEMKIEDLIPEIAQRLGMNDDDVKDTILTEGFINRYQQTLINIDRLDSYKRALDTQLELMENARSEYVRLQSSQSITARADAEFYRREWEKERTQNDSIRELIEGLKRNEEN